MKAFKKTEMPLVRLVHYAPQKKRTDTAFLIFPGGGYHHLSTHEGEGYAHAFCELGANAFVLAYRVAPDVFPTPLLDARRAVRYLRERAKELGIMPDRIVVIGSSAGGHLAALLSTLGDALPGEEGESTPYLPNAQVLCYPVTTCDEELGNMASYRNLLGQRFAERASFDPCLLAGKDTPPAFLWHTSTDPVVDVRNSYRYAEALTRAGVPTELHVFPTGWHGLGLAPDNPHTAQWFGLLIKFLELYGFLPKED